MHMKASKTGTTGKYSIFSFLFFFFQTKREVTLNDRLSVAPQINATAE